nr:ribosome production factor 1 [Cryptomonas sp.]
MNITRNEIIGITTSIKPNKKTLFFIQDLLNLIPNSIFFKRKDYKIHQIAFYFRKKRINNFLILVEKGGKLSDLWQISIENNLYIQFKIKTATLKKNTGTKGIRTNHNPELIFWNFKGNIGNLLGFFISKLFPDFPNFQGRQVLTFYLIKNLVFVRFYRYIFSSSGKDVRIQELGPRITLEFLRIYNKFPSKHIY